MLVMLLLLIIVCRRGFMRRRVLVTLLVRSWSPVIAKVVLGRVGRCSIMGRWHRLFVLMSRIRWSILVLELIVCVWCVE